MNESELTQLFEELLLRVEDIEMAICALGGDLRSDNQFALDNVRSRASYYREQRETSEA